MDGNILLNSTFITFLLINYMQKIQHKPGQFFIDINGKKSLLDYTIKGTEMDIFHTFTDPDLRGQGLAEQLAIAAFEYAKRNGFLVIPTCDYIHDSFLRKHPEWNEITEHW